MSDAKPIISFSPSDQLTQIIEDSGNQDKLEGLTLDGNTQGYISTAARNLWADDQAREILTTAAKNSPSGQIHILNGENTGTAFVLTDTGIMGWDEGDVNSRLRYKGKDGQMYDNTRERTLLHEVAHMAYPDKTEEEIVEITNGIMDNPRFGREEHRSENYDATDNEGSSNYEQNHTASQTRNAESLFDWLKDKFTGEGQDHSSLGALPDNVLPTATRRNSGFPGDSVTFQRDGISVAMGMDGQGKTLSSPFQAATAGPVAEALTHEIDGPAAQLDELKIA